MKIVADRYIPYIQDYFNSISELVLLPGRSITHEACKDADVLLVRSITPVNEALLANTKVKFVGSVTAGHDHLDTAWLDQANIAWTAAAGFNAPPVADYVVSCVAALDIKQLLPQKRRKAVVIGVGHVGQLVEAYLKKLNFDVLVCDPLRAETEKDFTSISLDEITDVDLITLHVPLTKSGTHPTYHFIDKDFLRRQKSGCVLINASRGSVVNSIDLMQYGAHLLWCLDVWEHEPIVDTMILEQAFIATPHIAGYSVQSKIRGIDMIYRALCAQEFIQNAAQISHEMPTQILSFAGSDHHWQDIVLGVFNPLVMTEMMRSVLLPVAKEERGHLFDELRHQFNYRYELGFTTVIDAQLKKIDDSIVETLGVACR